MYNLNKKLDKIIELLEKIAYPPVNIPTVWVSEGDYQWYYPSNDLVCCCGQTDKSYCPIHGGTIFISDDSTSKTISN